MAQRKKKNPVRCFGLSLMTSPKPLIVYGLITSCWNRWSLVVSNLFILKNTESQCEWNTLGPQTCQKRGSARLRFCTTFLSYINPIPPKLKSTVKLFADDTCATANPQGERAQIADLNHDCVVLMEMAAKLRMRFHPDKTKCLRLSCERSLRKRYKHLGTKDPIMFYGKKIEKVFEHKILGVNTS